MTTQLIRSALESAPGVTSEDIFEKQAEAFEEELLGLPDFPEEYLNLFVEIISDRSLFQKRGTWQFIVKVYTDRQKLKSSQLQRVLMSFITAFTDYSEETLCLTACDFIARTYLPREALESFKIMAFSSKRKEQLNSILVGLEILLRNLKEQPELQSQVQNLYIEVQGKFTEG